MNVGQVSRSLEIYQSSMPVKQAQQINKAQSRGNDTMTLSDTAKDFRTAIDALKNTPEVREDVVSKLRDKLSSNNYNVNANQISERILKSNFDAIG